VFDEVPTLAFGLGAILIVWAAVGAAVWAAVWVTLWRRSQGFGVSSPECPRIGFEMATIAL